MSPFEIKRDIRTESKVNSVFQLYMTIKRSGKSIDEFLASPGKSQLEMVDREVQKEGAVNSLRNNPFTAIINSSAKGNKLNNNATFRLGQVSIRGSLILSNCAPDEKTRNEYTVYNKLFTNEATRPYVHERNKFKKLNDIYKNPRQRDIYWTICFLWLLWTNIYINPQQRDINRRTCFRWLLRHEISHNR